MISGVRRAGKSTLLRLLADQIIQMVPPENILYLNFDDERLVHFTVDDFQSLLELFWEQCAAAGPYFFLLDEIQNIRYWEKWVNRLYEQEKIKVFVTGSNATLLNSEIASSLTGRNQTISLYPFSFREFLRLRNKESNLQLTSKQNVELFKEWKVYLERGAFPQVISSGNTEFLQNYFQDILYKDIIARYSIRHSAEIKEMAFYLASNLGNTMSYQKLASLTGIKSVSMIKRYWDYFQYSFLFFKIHKFDYSVKKQLYNPAKNYGIDVALMRQIGFSMSEKSGAALENIVFIHLRRRNKEVYYQQGKQECDFLVKEGRKIVHAIQVCQEIQPQNEAREFGGLLEALSTYGLSEGLILTENQERLIQKDGKKIVIQPVWKWQLE